MLDNKVEIYIPKDFNIMTEEMAKFKYPMEKRPQLIYTNETGTVNVAFKHLPTKITQDKLEEFVGIMKKMLSKMQPSALWYGNKVIDINNRKVGYLEMITPAIDTKIYNLMFMTELDGRILMVTFNCTEPEMKALRPYSWQIMNSLKVL